MGALSVTPIDILLAAVLILSAGLAFARGLVHETFAILEWVASAYAALRFTPALRPLLAGIVSPGWLQWGVVYAGTFLVVLIPLSFLCHRLEEVVRRSEVGSIDRVLGIVFGVGRGLVIASLAFIAYAALVPEKQRSPALLNARSYPLIRTTSAMLLDLVPGTKVAGIEVRHADADAARKAEDAKETTETTYGAGERRALDRLIEATGRGKERASKDPAP
jgi:membrane protein required for colicin V production